MTDIFGFNDYTINQNGEIYNKKMKIIMKQTLYNGYYKICLTNNEIRKSLKVHRLIYQAFILKKGEEMPETVDHKNNIGTDNSLSNLRGATFQENGRNKKTHKDNKSTGEKDIHKTIYNTFQVKIGLGKGIKTYFKNFKTIEEAVEHRNIKLKEFHGEFANNGKSSIY